jgi:phage tail sheath protein FI
MPKNTYPGVYVEEVPSGAHPIEGVRTSIAAFAGWALKGPTDHATLVSSWVEYEQSFGGFEPSSLLGCSVHHFFSNGGVQAYVVPLVGNGPSHADVGVLEPNTVEFENALLPDTGSGGLYLLDRVDLFNLLCVPGETKPSIIARLEKFCRERRAFLIVDCDEAATFKSLEGGLDPQVTGEDGTNAALYFPWVNAPDAPRPIPPCGFVAGVYARTDANRGVWKAAAGREASLAGATGVTVPLDDRESGVLNQHAINCIRSFPQAGTVVWGARTLRGSNVFASEWKYIPVRRLALFIEESLYRGTQWAVFEPNEEPLWARIRLDVNAFLHQLFRNGAFQGNTPREAYFVRCDSSTTTQADIDRGVVNIVVGFAPLKPAEFVVIRIEQMARQQEGAA